MKRIDILYGGDLFSINEREVDELRAEIDDMIADGGGWLTVNMGDHTRREAHLRLTAHTHVVLAPVPAGEEEPGDPESEAEPKLEADL